MNTLRHALTFARSKGSFKLIVCCSIHYLTASSCWAHDDETVWPPVAVGRLKELEIRVCGPFLALPRLVTLFALVLISPGPYVEAFRLPTPLRYEN